MALNRFFAPWMASDDTELSLAPRKQTCLRKAATKWSHPRARATAKRRKKTFIRQISRWIITYKSDFLVAPEPRRIQTAQWRWWQSNDLCSRNEKTSCAIEPQPNKTNLTVIECAFVCTAKCLSCIWFFIWLRTCFGNRICCIKWFEWKIRHYLHYCFAILRSFVVFICYFDAHCTVAYMPFGECDLLMNWTDYNLMKTCLMWIKCKIFHLLMSTYHAESRFSFDAFRCFTKIRLFDCCDFVFLVHISRAVGNSI